MKGITKSAPRASVIPNSGHHSPQSSQTVQKPTTTLAAKVAPPSIQKKVLTSTSVIHKTRRKSVIRIKPKANQDTKKEVVHHGEETFTQSQLIDTWKIYSDNIKRTAGGFSGSILTNCQPELLADSKTIHVIFRNETNELEFGRMSLELLEYLKSQLKNNHLNFTTEVSVAKAKKVLYTNRDKFEHFAISNPKLNDWMTKLGLELK